MLYHVYNISSDGSLIFYSDEDFLVFESTLCVKSFQYDVKVVACCIMRNHFHLFLESSSVKDLGAFVGTLQSTFIKEYNRNHSFHVNMLDSFGYSAKTTQKDIRSCLIYIANNPVEKSQCLHACDYRWNFLVDVDASAGGLRCKSLPVKKSKKIKTVLAGLDYARKQGLSIKYSLLENIKSLLSPEEYESVLEYATRLYDVVHHELAYAYFDGRPQFLDACQIVKGSEYEISEEYVHENYSHYDLLLKKIREAGITGSKLRDRASDGVFDIARELHRLGQLSDLELRRFFHL